MLLGLDTNISNTLDPVSSRCLNSEWQDRATQDKRASDSIRHSKLTRTGMTSGSVLISVMHSERSSRESKRMH